MGNLIFNLGLTGSFACLATAMAPDQFYGLGRHAAWFIVLCLLASYHLKLKSLQYTMQFLATLLLTAAHRSWSHSTNLSSIFPVAAIAIIDVTFVLVNSKSQWLHTLPSFYSWACYVLPIIIPLEMPEFTGASGGLFVALHLGLVGQLWLHRVMQNIPSQLGKTLLP